MKKIGIISVVFIGISGSLYATQNRQLDKLSHLEEFRYSRQGVITFAHAIDNIKTKVRITNCHGLVDGKIDGKEFTLGSDDERLIVINYDKNLQPFNVAFKVVLQHTLLKEPLEQLTQTLNVFAGSFMDKNTTFYADPKEFYIEEE